ncbi:MAG: sulfatase-like hydrolase/transferase, partial [Verrucomicrobiota bacterium]
MKEGDLGREKWIWDRQDACPMFGMVWFFVVCGCVWAAPPPNIVLFLADDMGMGDTSAYQDVTGNSDEVQLHTPNLERLAADGIRFTDAHTPASRCSPTRYGLLTGRYPWRSRLKWFVLFGAQGDPLIEADRPTLATMLQDHGYATGLFGKWHVGLRYRSAEGAPAAGWKDADLNQSLYTSPLDHGFDVARFTSRSHGTSGPGMSKKGKSTNGPDQTVGPGWLWGRDAIGATSKGRAIVETPNPNAYVLTELGEKNSDHAMSFLDEQVSTEKPFFLYYPAHANHGPYTPSPSIAGVPVAGASKTKAGELMDARHDLIYENDVAVGRLLDWLDKMDDPRNPGKKLRENTLFIFTSDNGAERNNNVATGPFRSNKGSCFEGGHRVAFLASWPAGGIPAGVTNPTPIGLQDLYATVAELLEVDLPEVRQGEKGGEDSVSILANLRG